MVIECRFEPLSYMLLNGLPDLVYEEWLESNYQEDFNIPYAPDWEEYQNLENCDKLRAIALREDGKLIGYASLIIGTCPQANGFLMATFRDLYITQSKRGHAARFVTFVEKQLSGIGVRRIRAGERANSPVKPGKFYQIMGYAPEEIIYGKRLN